MGEITSLLERKEELAAFERALDAAVAGVGGVLMIEGEAGAGKTSLLGEVGRLGAEREALVLRARGGEYERGFAYGVVRQLFEPLLAEDPCRAELLNGTAGAAAPIFEQDATAGTEVDPFAVQHGLYWLTADLAESAPLVLLVDDAQWADLATLRALAYIARRIEGLPVLLAVTVRTGEPGSQEALLDELRREPGAELIVPRPLTETAGSALAGKELGRSPSAKFAAACHRASAGNPFLIVELLRALAAEEIAPSDENADRLEGIAAAGVARSILIRLSRLGDAAVEAARAVAILEPNAEPEHVAALAELSAQDTAAACSRLIGARLLSDGRPLGFVHPLVRSAVYTDIPGPRRAFLHGEAAKRLAAAGGPVDSIAAHLLLAPPAGEPFVVETLCAAAREASGRGAPESAVELLRRARAEPPPPGERFEVERELGLAQLQAADAAGVETLLALRSSSDDPVIRAEIAAVLAISVTYRRSGSETAALLEQSIAELDGSDSQLELRLRGELLELSFWGAEGVPDWLNSTVEGLSGSSFEGRRLLDVSCFLEAAGLGGIERAARLARGAIPNLDSFREDALAGFPPTRACVALILADCGEEVERLYDTAADAARRRNMNAVAADCGMRAFCRILDGELTLAQPDAEMAFEISLPLGLPPFSATWRIALVWALIGLGELDAAHEIVVRDIPEGDLEPGLLGAFPHCVRGELRSARGEHEAARRDFAAAGSRLAWLPFANPRGPQLAHRPRHRGSRPGEPR